MKTLNIVLGELSHFNRYIMNYTYIPLGASHKTSALDADTEIMLKDSFNALAQSRTAFLIIHQMSFTDIASRIPRFQDGYVIEVSEQQ